MPHNILENLQLIENTGLFCHEKPCFLGRHSSIPPFQLWPARSCLAMAGGSKRINL